MTDQNRKTLRSFYCRDYIWDLFEQMAQELGCSMDYLINESMRLYARSRDYAVSNDQVDDGAFGPGPGAGAPGYGAPQAMPGQRPGYGGGHEPSAHARNFERMPTATANRGPIPSGGHAPAAPGPYVPPAPQPFQQQPPMQPHQPPMQQRGPGGPPPPPPRPGAATAGWQAQPRSPQMQQPQMQQPQMQQPPMTHQQPPPQAGFGGDPGYHNQARSPLFLIFNDNRYTIDKDQFVIGRGSQDTDLTIRDGNISRKHCAVIFRNGQFYIKDLDSVNGIEYRGNRIESKKIDDGDVFYLCDHELRFTHRG